MSLGVITGSVVGQTGVTLLARLRGAAGQLVTASSLVSITYQVADLTLGTVITSGSFLIPSASGGVIYDGLVQNDPRWTFDGVTNPDPRYGDWGYNFLATIPATTFALATLQAGGPPAPHLYQIDTRFTPTSGQVFEVAWQVTVYPTFL